MPKPSPAPITFAAAGGLEEVLEDSGAHRLWNADASITDLDQRAAVPCWNAAQRHLAVVRVAQCVRQQVLQLATQPP
jgi:hypothetical protein